MKQTFDCPRWPGCGCPDGSIVPDCPGVPAKPITFAPDLLIAGSPEVQRVIGAGKERAESLRTERSAGCWCTVVEALLLGSIAFTAGWVSALHLPAAW